MTNLAPAPVEVPTWTPAQIRAALEEAVIADLLGPANGPDEIVEEHDVRGRYLVGLLAPRGQRAMPEEWDDQAQGGTDGEDGVTEAPAPKASASMLPSSLGLTFVVSGEAPALQVTARWGRYTRIPNPKRTEPDADPKLLERVWQRHPVEGVSPPIPLAAGRIRQWQPHPDQPEVYVDGLVRRRDELWHVTLFLVNGQREQERSSAGKDSAWLFQPQLVVEAVDGAPVFQQRPLRVEQGDEEQAGLAMRYRRQVEFAIGHGVAVQAELAPGRSDRAVRLTTAVLPVYEAPLTAPPTAAEVPLLAELTLDMQALAEIPDGHFGRRLAALTEAYAAWITELRATVDAPDSDLAPFQEVAQRALAHCDETRSRIAAGIALLDADPVAAQAFRFANRAMALQRTHSLYAAQVRQGHDPVWAEIDTPANRSWRPFQLAFLLLNLPAMTDPTHADRSQVADLLFFPTGGGKTEAYLGVAAYTLAMRRLQGTVSGYAGHAGVGVLMRYTLRLLTLQQFQRAAALICACETIRREDAATWGPEPFRIGLWVGRNTTPNWTKDAAEAVKDLRESGQTRGAGTPHQLTNCPWCGRKIEPGKDIVVRSFEHGECRTLVFCGDPAGRCPFSRAQSPGEGIPILTVDEEIYRRLPALLIATVDKFAQMPWNGRTAMLFGRVSSYCPRHGYRSPEIEDSDSHPANKKYGLAPVRSLPSPFLRPPDLIIQDELHLISGPLGSLVGLYETAVEALCSWQHQGRTVRPKVIASTATVRQAAGQVHSLFVRRLNVFPPPGLDAGDSFFSREHDVAERPGRRYLGICAPGILHKTALIRVYTTLLSAAQRLYEQAGAAADPWMTLVGYFNSLRELGGIRRAVDDSVSARLTRMEQRNLARRFLNPWSVEELTSRLGATDIPEILDKLEQKFDPATAKGLPREKRPIDVLLATNMISVGVDVGRLGLMVAAGQPKTTAEYIQATSRVGRSAAGPGLVCVVYNWTRPRDLSHYEAFCHYHATFYQHVEALSVTPFSAGAIRRGLSALLVAEVRLRSIELNGNADVVKFVRDHPATQAAVASIRARAAEVNGEATAQLVDDRLAARIDRWLARIAGTVGATLVYNKQGGTTVGLLDQPSPGRWEPFTCLNSLRDVEPTAKLVLEDHGLDREGGPSWAFHRQPEPADLDADLQDEELEER
jgi:hypothetical protein